jgi:hypothetical protein
MSELSMSQFLSRDDLDEARRAAQVKAAQVVTRLQQSGQHWTLTVKKEK